MVCVMSRRLVKCAVNRIRLQHFKYFPGADVGQVFVLRRAIKINRLACGKCVRVLFHNGQRIIVQPALPDFPAKRSVRIIKPVNFAGIEIPSGA